MLTTDRIILFGWPGADFNTDADVVTRWAESNPWPQPTAEEIEAKRHAAEDHYRRERLVITSVQGRRRLSEMGKRAIAEQIVAAAPEDVQDFWQYETEWRRNSPMINRFAPLLGIDTEEAKDEFFETAALIKAV